MRLDSYTQRLCYGVTLSAGEANSSGVMVIGTLCNGALHWVMFSGIPLTHRLISFDLSKEVFKEIRQPDDAIRECRFLGIRTYLGPKLQGMHKFNVKRYWENTRHNYYALKIYSKDLYTFIPATVMPSLISPHLQEGNE
ncbi:hypothetical protein Tco_0698812 [Tanacetum coccineum]